MPEIPFAATLIVCLTAGAALRVSAGTVRWARIRRRRASPSHLASTAQNRLCASFPRSPDHHFPEFWFKTRDTQTIHRASVPLYSLPYCYWPPQDLGVFWDQLHEAVLAILTSPLTW